jgi:hypothetical protein
MKRFSLGGAMALIATVTLIMALIVQARRAAERESRYQAEIAGLREELDDERLQLVKPNYANMSEVSQHGN